MDPAALGLAAGAVLSGLGSFIAAASSIRIHKKKAQDECDLRIRELERAFRRGMTVERRRKDDDDRWSHLP